MNIAKAVIKPKSRKLVCSIYLAVIIGLKYSHYN